VVALRAVALALKGLLVLWVLHLGLALIGIVVLIVWGVALIITAHPVHPVRILGVVNDAAEIYEGHTYVRTELSLSGDGPTLHDERSGNAATDVPKPPSAR
jgi:hypothetical protein